MKIKFLKKKNKIYHYLKKVKLCPYGYTQVILSPPIFKGYPMPNVFWLVCPFLVLSNLEGSCRPLTSLPVWQKSTRFSENLQQLNWLISAAFNWRFNLLVVLYLAWGVITIITFQRANNEVDWKKTTAFYNAMKDKFKWCAVKALLIN